MVWERLMQVIAEIPAQTEAVRGDAHKLSFRAQPLKEHDQLQLEKDHRINGGTSASGIIELYQIPHKGAVEGALEVAIEVIGGNEILE
jgi:hypothetical protein